MKENRMKETHAVSSTLVGTDNPLEFEITMPININAVREAHVVDRALSKLEGLHRHLCPRQVLGVRMGLYAGGLLALDVPREDKRLFVFMETDGCFVDGVIAATGCNVGRRTMRILDFGKVACTFVDLESGEAIRIVPRFGVRVAAREYAPAARNRWTAQLEGYQVMPAQELLKAEQVQLTVDLVKIISRAGVRVNCDGCGEEIINQREVIRDGRVLCRQCAGDGYYARIPEPRRVWSVEGLDEVSSN
jgi:formylmethanofuran dehydrogenase subunit E